MAKAKLLLIAETMGGGVRKHVIDLIHGLDPQRFDITLVYGARHDAVFESSQDDLAKYARLIRSDYLVRSVNPVEMLKAVKELTAIIDEIHPDVVHCHSSMAGISGRIAARLRKVDRIFYTPHAYAFAAPEFGKVQDSVFEFIDRFLSRHATSLTFNVSAGERDLALQHKLDAPGKFEVIYNGLPDVDMPSRAEARERLGLDETVGITARTPLVGVAAWAIQRKDPMTFMRIAEMVIADRKNAHEAIPHFVYIGEGELWGEMRDYAQAHGFAERFHQLPYRQDADVLLKAFDVYLLASLYEGMPYSLIEAIRAGVPTVATRTTGNDEVVLPGINGELFPVGDVQAGAAAVEKMLNSPYSFEQIRRSFLERFTLDSMLTTLQRHYLSSTVTSK